MRRTLSLALALTLPPLASAQAPAAADRVDWALCLSGEGCHVCESSLTHAQADQALGALGLISDAPGHTVTVMRKNDGNWTWYYDTRRPARELDRYFGGPGRAKQSACATLPGDHVPRDGQWSVANGKATLKNCPAALAGQVQAMQMFRSGPVTFAKPFRAADALPGKDVAWLQSGPNQHVGSFAPAGKAGLRARYALTVESPERMAGTLQVFAPIPGQPTCEVAMPFTYRRTGD
ncbi:hypothetical protein [Arenimonas metalli]|uniref:Uncharacterized protein n=1 Tax=Arenimonas metalli CF5-1 TaxID=1384056 RepID=A0A091B8P4_9GAMM|nr:hypothetical protein [Arenimonas metalli]KFN48106.1 hypothetical protein N787_06610 [Arenimonas metalli CF5-1]